ncbi:dTDP-4-dehydrorhamnose reductase [Pedobacter cryoconitis]|uniref:dTDP-4-dehydrorhamnose reductase n=1 Tax=Pedobacter cryoconitis TaxID=188932 RepID=A0A127VJJ6_9SPHI|nr:dTDP-4-dehydrorhamnose reductase [Pedobacter cryoconitis]AMQ01371.1 dTDP-4-dehydrorhamnose reductase [Pedobacter cryoconitis]
MKRNIIVIGGSGQLGQCLNEVISGREETFNYIFLSRSDLDFVNSEDVKRLFEHYKPLYCINCAAYTEVDRAEEDLDRAFEVNEFAVKRLAENCLAYDTTLLHISTDFVFDGDSGIPLTEDKPTNPVNAYGLSKLNGELQIQQVMEKYYIIRTSWLYSEKANNFVKTMLKLAQSRDQLQVIYDQVGTPTYAVDLAKVIVNIIKNDKNAYGVYHYSNEGVASWYDFAKAVFEFAEIDMKVLPVTSSVFVTKAKRPHYSVMDKTKIKSVMGIEIPYWRDSLNFCIQNL